MQIRSLYILVFPIAILGSNGLRSQDSPSLYNKLYNLPDKVFNGMNKKSKNLEEKMIHQTEKYLMRLERQEKKLKKKLMQKDSISAVQTFGDIEKKYAKLREKLHSETSTVANLNTRYSPYLDSLKTGLAFLDKLEALNGKNQVQQKLNAALGSYQSLQGALNGVEEVRRYVKARDLELRSQFEKLGMKKELDAFKKQVYYYRAQMDEYKSILDDPSKAEAKLLELANKFPKFKSFFSKYSDLAQLFPTPGDFGSPASLTGLQTRAGIQQYIQDRLGAAGPNAFPAVQQNIQDAQQQLNSLKNKVNQLGKSSNDADMPDFKPNNQKTKSVWKRIELGTNIQTGRSNSFFPVTSDLGLSVGYKLNDKSIIGIGASYKMGWGQNIRNLKITQEGVGLRSFLDVKVKGSFYASGGFEYNYQKAFNSMQQLYVLDDWQQSGLLGVSKIVSLNNKFFKKTKVQLLWDFLSYRQIPQSSPLKFRVGYGFK